MVDDIIGGLLEAAAGPLVEAVGEFAGGALEMAGELFGSVAELVTEGLVDEGIDLAVDAVADMGQSGDPQQVRQQTPQAP